MDTNRQVVSGAVAQNCLYSFTSTQPTYGYSHSSLLFNVNTIEEEKKSETGLVDKMKEKFSFSKDSDDEEEKKKSN